VERPRDREVSDGELIPGARAGDVNAFATLVQRHQDFALRVATVALGTSQGADDVAQEAFVRLFRTIGRFRDGAALEPWLARIVTNVARNHQRGERRVASRWMRLAGQRTEQAASADHRLDVEAERTVVSSALAQLSTEDRLILTYRWYVEMSEAEMADALGCARGTVKSRLSRAMARLRAQLDAPNADLPRGEFT